MLWKIMDRLIKNCYMQIESCYFLLFISELIRLINSCLIRFSFSDFCQFRLKMTIPIFEYNNFLINDPCCYVEISYFKTQTGIRWEFALFIILAFSFFKNVNYPLTYSFIDKEFQLYQQFTIVVSTIDFRTV